MMQFQGFKPEAMKKNSRHIKGSGYEGDFDKYLGR